MTMRREALAERRRCETFNFAFQGEKYIVTIGYYPDGRVGEVFINRVMDRTSAKIGMLLDGVCRDSAILLSLALQHGCEMETITGAVTRDEDGGASTIVGAILDHLRPRLR